MTDHRALKQAIRRRMQQTGEKYTDARRAVVAPAGALQTGETRTALVAWRLDDPAVQDDGRFWSKVPDELAEFHRRPAGTILPKGQSLAFWRERAHGEEVQLPTMSDSSLGRVSLARWKHANPDRTYVILSFESRPAEFVGRTAEEIERISAEQRAERGAREIKPKLSDETVRLKGELAELQRQFREACDREDEQRMAELRTEIEAQVQKLSRADFPHFTQGWDWSRAIRERSDVFVLDWTTGY